MLDFGFCHAPGNRVQTQGASQLGTWEVWPLVGMLTLILTVLMRDNGTPEA